MYFDNPEKGESLGAFEIMGERYAQLHDAVVEINRVVPAPEVKSAPNIVGLSQMVDQMPSNEEYLRGLEDAA